MGGTCNTHGRDEKFIEYQSEKLKGKEYFGDQGLDGRRLLRIDRV
jgi:hypothetical protein